MKSVPIQLGFTAACCAVDTGIQKKINSLGRKTSVNVNEEIENIINIIKLLKKQLYRYKVLLKQLNMKQNFIEVDFLVYY